MTTVADVLRRELEDTRQLIAELRSGTTRAHYEGRASALELSLQLIDSVPVRYGGER